MMRQEAPLPGQGPVWCIAPAQTDRTDQSAIENISNEINKKNLFE